MIKNITSDDVIRRRHYADLGEWGEFYAGRVEMDTIDTGHVFSGFRAYGTWKRYFQDPEDPWSEIVEDGIAKESVLEVALTNPLPVEEAAEMTAGEIFQLAWDVWFII